MSLILIAVDSSKQPNMESHDDSLFSVVSITTSERIFVGC